MWRNIHLGFLIALLLVGSGCRFFKSLDGQLVAARESERNRALKKLAMLPPEERRGHIPALIRKFENDDDRIADRAVAALSIIGPDAVPALTGALESSDVFVRLCAIATLEKMGILAKDAIPALTRALDDPHPLVREQAEEVLKKLQEKS